MILQPWIYTQTTLYVTTSKWNNVYIYIKENLNINLGKLEQWSSENRMFINAKKTKSMVIVTKRLRVKGICLYPTVWM